VITCPECLRAFPQSVSKNSPSPNRTCCMHCFRTVQFAFVQTAIAKDKAEVVALADELSHSRRRYA